MDADTSKPLLNVHSKIIVEIEGVKVLVLKKLRLMKIEFNFVSVSWGKGWLVCTS